MFDDLRAACRRDPALYGVGVLEVLLYPGVWAVWAHRVAHRLYRCGLPLIPRALSFVARLFTGIEIHPGARIGRRLFIDHGAGVVIGQTARIGDDVMMYHQVTLGARGWWTDRNASQRHPIVGDRVVLGVGATLLGPIHVGDDARIGAHCLVVSDVPAGCHLRAPTAVPPALSWSSHDLPERDGTDRPYADGAAGPIRRGPSRTPVGQTGVAEPRR
jgi:serine O-acetyltransferase